MSNSNDILTPMQLWQNFDAFKPALKYNIASVRKENGLIFGDIYFDALVAEDGIVRACINSIRPAGKDPLPALLFIADNQLPLNVEICTAIAALGFAVFRLDYCGDNGKKDLYTKYPPSLNYGNYSTVANDLYSAANGLENTSVFLWSKLARRAITLINALPRTNGKIGIVGIKGGGNIAWQVAATDDRVNCFISLLNGGWQEYLGIYKYGEETLTIDEEKERWLACSSVQAYAKFVKCPFLFLGCSNNRFTPAERLGDTIKLLPNQQDFRMSLTTGTLDQLEYESLQTLYAYINAHLKEECEFKLKSPLLTLSEAEGKLTASIKCDISEDIADCVLSYCHAEPYPSLRYWHRLPLGVNVEGKASDNINIYEDNLKIFAFATVYYKNGIMLSSAIEVFDAKDVEFAPVKKSRIIYERKMGLAAFVTDSKNDLFITRDSVSLISGPLDILGVATSTGDLSNYAIGDPKYRGEAGYILQFDAYTAKNTTCELQVFSVENKDIVRYFTTFEVVGGNWQKISLDVDDFKTKTMQPLKDWSSVKKMSFKNSANLLVNNILWV